MSDCVKCKQVLTRRLGSVAMLSVIYSESLKMLRLCGSLDFDAEIRYPRDFVDLPRGYQKQNSKVSDEAHLMTSQSLLVEVGCPVTDYTNIYSCRVVELPILAHCFLTYVFVVGFI